MAMNGMQRAVSMTLLVLVGCSSAGAWSYKPVLQSLGPAPLSPARVSVLPFDDRRPEGNEDWALLYLIPINPVGPFEYNRIEAGAHFLTHSAYQIRPREDLAQAVVSELRTANLFQEVFFTEREREPEIRFILQGRVDEFKYEGKIISYGLSIYGPYLWLLGLPSGHANNSFQVGMELKRTESGDVVWRCDPARAERSITAGLYYNWGKEFDGYQSMMHDAMSSCVADLVTAIKTDPSRFQ